jgi:hypothetical protein
VQPVIAALAILRAVAGNKRENRQVRKFLDVLLALTGFAFLAHTGWRTYTDWATLDPREIMLEFLLPVWLTAGLLPCIYVLKGIFIVKYEGKRAKGQKYALNPSRIEDISTLANEGIVSDPSIEQWFFKDNNLVSARDLDDWTPI